MKQKITALLIMALLPACVLGYGARGHAMVGAIADLRLSIDKPTQAKVAKLLDGISLAQAATIADSIKSWDICVEHTSMDVPVAGGARINAELRAFVKANPCDSKPNHREFHYTDVPIAGDEKYSSGSIGRSDYDIVHMIAYCIKVLAGVEPEKNKRAITKSVAVILLAHYLGDIHQPLHVGAEYFDDNGDPVEPSQNIRWHGDQGGNKLDLFWYADGKPKALGNLHSYWDTKVVDDAFEDRGDNKIALEFAQNEPLGWRLTGDPDSLAQQMADEILPIAREAHRRLQYSKVRAKGNGDIDGGRALDPQNDDHTPYSVWSQAIVKFEIQKAGWRLAAILSAALADRR